MAWRRCFRSLRLADFAVDTVDPVAEPAVSASWSVKSWLTFHDEGGVNVDSLVLVGREVAVRVVVMVVLPVRTQRRRKVSG